MTSKQYGIGQPAAVSRVLLLGCVSAWLGCNNASPNHPVAEISETIIDFGVVGTDEMATRELTISNTGREPLIIEDINLSCGCVEVVSNDAQINGGNSGKIRIAVRARPGRFGPTEEFMVLSTNSPVTPDMRVTFRYDSGRGIRFSPDAIDVGRIERDKLPKSLSVRIDSSPDFDVDASELRVTGEVNPWIGANLTWDGSTRRLDVTVEKNHPAGQFFWLIPLAAPTSGRSFQVSVHGNIRGQIWAMPSTAVIGPVNPDEPNFLQRIQLKSRADEPAVWTGKFDDELSELLRCSVDDSEANILPVIESWKRFGRKVVRGRLIMEAKWVSGKVEQLSIPVTLVVGPRQSQF